MGEGAALEARGARAAPEGVVGIHPARILRDRRPELAGACGGGAVERPIVLMPKSERVNAICQARRQR
eukprot:65696-Prymnesium_polylepis.1